MLYQATTYNIDFIFYGASMDLSLKTTKREVVLSFLPTGHGGTSLLLYWESEPPLYLANNSSRRACASAANATAASYEPRLPAGVAMTSECATAVMGSPARALGSGRFTTVSGVTNSRSTVRCA